MSDYSSFEIRMVEDLQAYHGLLPSQLPSLGSRWVTFDTETTGLYPDLGAMVTVVSVSWHDANGTKHAYAWPFNQGLYGKPEFFNKAFFGEEKLDEPILSESKEVVLFKSGPRAGQPKTRRIRRRISPLEVLPPNPNLGPDEWRALCEWLAAHYLNAHNGLFDVIMMGTETVCWDPSGVTWRVPGVDLLENLKWDSMLGNRIVWPQHPLGLEETAARLFGGGKTEEQERVREGLKARRLPMTKGNWHLADWEDMGPYALGDASLTAPVGRMQWEEMKKRGIPFERMEDELRVLRTLVQMERKGLPYNAVESLKWAELLEARAAEIETELPFKPTPNGARQFYFTEDVIEDPDDPDKYTCCLGLTPDKKSETTGDASVDAEVVAKLVEQGRPHARLFQELRLTLDAASRYYRGYAERLGPDGRIRTRFRQTGTQTYRLSCEGLNLQAIPHDHRLLVSDSKILAEAPSPRALIYPMAGYKIWHADLEQAELRVATQFARATSMLQILEAGLDPHGETAIALGLATGPESPNWFKARSVVGKRSNFSLIFGIGPKKFKEDLGKNGLYLPLNEVTKIRDDWHGLYPEFKEAIYLHMNLAEQDGWTQIRGDVRKWYTQRERLLHDWHKAFNNRVQGNIGLFTQHWMLAADDYLSQQDIDPTAGLMLQIHDALVLMLPDTPEGDAMAEHVAQMGRDMWTDWFTVPGGVDLKEWKHG